MELTPKTEIPLREWKRWDVRADGKVFWAYDSRSKNYEHWVSFEQALKNQDTQLRARKTYLGKPENRARDRVKEKIRLQKPENRAKREARRKSRAFRAYRNLYDKAQYDSNPIFLMSKRLRSRIRNAIRRKGYSKTTKTCDMLGCTWEEFKAHIESKFINGMCWDNKHLWHIDHIIPLATATSIDEVVRLNHYTNLQPLWAVDNLQKGCKL